ncbi:oligosaccharide flippase family protein [Globicatella sulfidifaciens]|uniref:oligosaccharide flippase family protein n=1 Tax=Globicatella sulfidifaciens TaxID=136093 RepID=UPI00288E1700|nr:oligosaccharide flippase family protein [Globicatella sulfidifaciens]MDT2767647.1 oligosaccharide flippase family protein [Globicatella sulfidifaciens]
MKFLRNIIKVTMSNLLGFGTSFIIGFILPAILTVENYGYYKQYTLFISFAHLANLGINDAIYIKYGGKDKYELDVNELAKDHNFMLVVQFFVFILMLIYSFLSKNNIIFYFTLTTLFICISTFQQNLFQAIGEFNIFSLGNAYKSLFLIIILFIQVFFIKDTDYESYILTNVFSFILLTLYYEVKFLKFFKISNNFNFKESLKLISIGFFVLIANMSMTFVGNIGSWIVNFNYEITDFAQYSFQNSLLNVVLLIVNGIGLVFYNILAKRTINDILSKIKFYCIIIGILACESYFILDFIIQKYLSKYSQSLELLSIIFLALPFIFVSKILIVNLYKVYSKPQNYFSVSVIFSISSFIFIYIIEFVFSDMKSIAFATVVSYFLWYLYNNYIKFPKLQSKKKLTEMMIISSFIIVFWICSNKLPLMSGFIVYSIFLIILLIYLFIKKDDYLISLN